MARAMWLVALLIVPSAHPGARADERGPIGHWRLAGDAKDASGRGNHGQVVGVDLTAPGPDGRPAGAARFDGKGAFIRGPGEPVPGPRHGRLHARRLGAHRGEARRRAGRPGEQVRPRRPARAQLVHQERRRRRRTARPMTATSTSASTPAPSRSWTDRGRPGNAVYVMAMAVHDGTLFVGTCEAGAGEAGHVYRYDGGTRWVDCGSPDRCNAVTSLAAYGGKLYAGHGPIPPGRLLAAGIDEREPRAAGSSATTATALGRMRPAAATSRPWAGWSSSAATSTPRRCTSRPASSATGGADEWAACPLPADGRRVVALGVFNGHLYAGSYDGCSVCRFDGESWEPSARWNRPGRPTPSRSTRGELFVGTWPNGQVFRLDRGERVGLGRAAGRGEGGHGHGRPQRQALRRHAAAGRGLPPRRRRDAGPGPAGST